MEEGRPRSGMDRVKIQVHGWNSQTVTVKKETVFIFSGEHGSLSPSLLTHLSPFGLGCTHPTELTVSLRTKLRDSRSTCTSWKRPTVYTASCVQDTFPRRLPRPHAGAERPAEGRDQCHQRQIPEPKWSMAFPLRTVNPFKVAFPLCILTEPYLQAGCWSTVTQSDGCEGPCFGIVLWKECLLSRETSNDWDCHCVPWVPCVPLLNLLLIAGGWIP